MKLKGMKVIVTGAAGGIGRGIAERMLSEGADVLLNDIDPERLENTCESLGNAHNGRVYSLSGDVSSGDTVERMFDRAEKIFGGIDVLVNNAANVNCYRHFLDYDEDFWDSIIKTNLKSMYLCSHSAAVIMAEQRSGCIINLSSIGSVLSHQGLVAYDTSKGAVDSLTRALAIDLAPWDIRVNAIRPAVVKVKPGTRIDKHILADKDPEDFDTPLLIEGLPKHIAGMAVFLAGEDSAFVTGQIFNVDGGMSARCRPYVIPKEKRDNWKRKQN